MRDASPVWDDGVGDDLATALRPESTADVIIVGGGIMGAAAAWYLAGRGRQVTLLEKGRIAGEQSGRNWGWVRQQNRDPDELPMMIEANRIWQQLEADLGADIEWTMEGNLSLARDPARLAFFRDWLSIGRGLGIQSELLSESEIRARLPGVTGSWLGGLFTPSDGHAEPTKATRALARGARARGATIIEDCGVDRLLTDGHRVVGVETEFGPVRAPHVILAAGVWSARLLRAVGIDLPIRIVKNTVARSMPVAPISGAGVGYHPVVSFRQRRDGSLYIAAGGWSDYDITLESFRHLRLFLPNYVKNRRLIKVHVGGPLVADVRRTLSRSSAARMPWRHERVLSPPPSSDKVRVAVAAFRDLFPDVPVTIDRAWAGYIDSTPDAVPVIDQPSTHPGLTIATGFSGHGFAMGPIVGRMCSELVVDGESSIDLAPFRLARFKDGSYRKARLVT